MFTIRSEQMEILKRYAAQSFTDRMVKHLNQFFPEECRRAGGERVRAAIQQGIARAARYGITSEVDVARYVDLSVVLGLDFDAGARFPWAREILNRVDLDGAAKVQELQRRARQPGQDALPRAADAA